MLELYIPGQDMFDEKQNMFIKIRPQTLQLEHSLVSISKWESKWCKPFMTAEQKTREETIDYIRCMTINTKAVDENIYNYIPDESLLKVKDYIEAPMTATTIKNNGKNSKKIITSELIYCWMIGYHIPVEFEKWHIKRLMTLLAVCEAENNPKKKMTQQEIMARNKRLNAERKQKMHTRG